MILSRCVANIFYPVPYWILDTEWLAAILTDFLLLFTASVIYYKNISMPHRSVASDFDLYFQPSMSDFATAVLLIGIAGA